MISQIIQGSTPNTQTNQRTANNKNTNARNSNTSSNNARTVGESAVYERSSVASRTPGNINPNFNEDIDVDAVLRNQREQSARNIISLFQQNFDGQVSSGRSSSQAAMAGISRAEAQELVSEDGFWGVEQTSERLFNIAESIAGGDPEMMEKMRAAVMKGFEAAERQWGDTLPDISHQTLDAIMKKFDEWQPA